MQRLADGTWDMPRVEVLREAAGTQLAMTYIGRKQATVAQWIALRPIFEGCASKTGYKGGSFRREDWWRQGVTDKKLWATLEEISRKSRIWR